MKLLLYASVATFLLLSPASFAARMVVPAAPPSGAGMTPPETGMIPRLLIYLGRHVFSLVFVYLVAPAAPAAETIGPLARNVIQVLLARGHCPPW